MFFFDNSIGNALQPLYISQFYSQYIVETTLVDTVCIINDMKVMKFEKIKHFWLFVLLQKSHTVVNKIYIDIDYLIYCYNIIFNDIIKKSTPNLNFDFIERSQVNKDNFQKLISFSSSADFFNAIAKACLTPQQISAALHYCESIFTSGANCKSSGANIHPGSK